MGRYLEMLLALEAKLQKPQTGSLQNPQNQIKEGSVGFEGAPPGHSQKLITPANDPAQPSTVTDRQRAFLKREPLVTEAELNKMQRQLLGHLLTCRDCVVEDHLYCQQGGRDGSGYQGFLCEFPDAEQRHADFVGVVIQARIRGLQAGFTALEALTRQDRDTGRETARGASYGIDNRPAELAFVNHFTACAYCFPRSGKYCGEGRELHELARLETPQ